MESELFSGSSPELLKKAIDEHIIFNTAELDRCRPVKKERQQEDNSVNRYQSTCTRWAQASSER